jgi:hypothetical protein
MRLRCGRYDARPHESGSSVPQRGFCSTSCERAAVGTTTVTRNRVVVYDLKRGRLQAEDWEDKGRLLS